MKKILSTLTLIATVAILITSSCTKESMATGGTGTNCVDTLRKVITPAFASYASAQAGATSTVTASVDITPFCESKKVFQLIVSPALTGMTPSGTTLANLTLYYKGAQIGTTQSFDGSTPVVFSNLSNQLTLVKDSLNTLVVKADIKSANMANYTNGSITMNLSIPVGSMQGVSTHNVNTLPIIFPAQTVRITNATLAIARNSAVPNGNTPPNTTNVKEGSYVLQNTGSTDPLRITTIEVDVAGTNPLANLSNLKVTLAGNISTPTPLVAPTNFFSTDVAVLPGNVKTLDVFADQGATVGGTVITSVKVTYFNVVSNLMTVSDLVTGQTMTVTVPAVNTPTFVVAPSTAPQYVAVGNSGQNDAAQSVFNFYSSTGNATITELRYSDSYASAMTMVKVNATAVPFVSGIATIMGISLTVPAGGAGLNVQALQSYGGVGTAGIPSGTLSRLTLVGYKYSAGGTTYDVTCNVPANQMKLVASKPQVTVDLTPHTGLVTGTEVLLAEYTETADTHGNVGQNQIKWVMANSGFTSGFNITSVRTTDGTGTTIPTATTVIHTGADYVTTTFSPEYLHAAGTTKTFRLYGVVSGVMNGSAMINTTIDKSGFKWHDVDGSGAASAEDGNLIWGFSTNAYTIKQ